jgi:arylsulfatase A
MFGGRIHLVKSRKMKAKTLTLIVLLISVSSLRTDADEVIGRPNIIVILADDMGWGDMRSHGNDRIDTPNLDSLAAESVELERFFVAPLCAPTRAAMLTGRHHVRFHVLSPSGGLDTMPPSATTDFGASTPSDA